MLDVEVTFCYLGDMLCSGGGCDSAIAARCCVTWGKFKKLLPVRTTKHLSPTIYVARCMRPAFTWLCSMVVKREWLRCNDRAMIRWICGMKDVDETPSASLLQKLGIKDITPVLPSQQLIWYGNVQQAMALYQTITKHQLWETSMPSTRQCAWPLVIWKRHLIVYPDMSSGGFFASSA